MLRPITYYFFIVFVILLASLLCSVSLLTFIDQLRLLIYDFSL